MHSHTVAHKPAEVGISIVRNVLTLPQIRSTVSEGEKSHSPLCLEEPEKGQ